MQIRSMIVYLFVGSAALQYTPAAFLVEAGILEADSDFKTLIGLQYFQNVFGGLV